MVSIKIVGSILIAILLTGCGSTPKIKLPVFSEVEIMNFYSEGIIHNGVQGEFVTFPVWQGLQEDVLDGRLRANGCRNIMLKYNKSIK